MARYIDADKLIADGWHLEKVEPTMWGRMISQRGIKSVPTADVEEVKHGEWIEDGYYDNPCVCSYCGAEAMHNNKIPKTHIRTPYCSQCGAKMDGGKAE